MALARLQEDKINDRRKTPRSSFPPPQTQAPSLPIQTQTSRPKTPFIQCTPEDMMYRRKKGLCYNCDEKWSSSHRCKGRVLLFIVYSDESSTSDITLTEGSPQSINETVPPFDPTPLHPQISLHAMAGIPAIDTFRLYGVNNHARVTILVDSDSTHNFIQPRVAKFLGLAMEETMALRVMVGNDSVLECRQLCPATSLLIQDHSFTVTLRILPLSGADVVLGIEWLSILGPIITDYTSFTMHFSHLGQPVSLHADVHTNTDPTSAHQLRRSIHTHSVSGLFHLSLIPVTLPEPDTDPPHPISTINDLLLKFQTLFQQPTTLPPP